MTAPQQHREGDPTLSGLNAALQRLAQADRNRFLRELRAATRAAASEGTRSEALAFRAGLARTSGDPTAPAWEAVAREAQGHRHLRLVAPLDRAD